MWTTTSGNIWLHALFPELKVRLDDAIEQFQGEDDKRADAIDDVFADFAHGQLVAPCYETQKVESWLDMKLEGLKSYDHLLEHDKQCSG